MVHDPASKPEGENGSAGAGTNGEGAIAQNGSSNGANLMNNIFSKQNKRCAFVYQVTVGYVVEVKVSDRICQMTHFTCFISSPISLIFSPYQILHLQLNNGSTYEGVWHSIDSNKLVLRMARLVSTSAGKAPRSTMPERTKEFPMGEWVSINAKDVRMGASDVGIQGASDDAGGFGTDAAISRGRGAASGRELQRWAPDVDDEHLMHLEDSVKGPQRGWDQFALNEQKFGVRTDYHEELYTTALDPSKSKISVAEAERLATEIERGNRSNTTNIHLLEERGIEVDDGDMDEEDRYGAVIRDAQPPDASLGVPQRGVQTPTRPTGAWGRGAPPTVTAPISIDPRREANKVRAQMTGSSGPKAASPYGTPKQLASPLVGDAQKLAALNLDPGVTRVDAATRRDFEAFKAQQRTGPGSSPGGNFSSLSEMKQFSESVGTKLQKTISVDKTPSTTPTAAAGVDAAQPPATTTSPGEAPKKSSGLNPNAKSFNFNINAKEFVFTPKAPTTTSTTPAPSSTIVTAPRPAVIPQQQMYHTPAAGPSRVPPQYRPVDSHGHSHGPGDMSSGDGGPPGPSAQGYYARKRDDAGPRDKQGGYDYRKPIMDQRRHHDMRSTPPYPTDGGGGHPPPPPGAHAHAAHSRSPPTGMAMGPGMPTMMGGPMGGPMMMPAGTVFMAPGMPAGPGVPGRPAMQMYAIAPGPFLPGPPGAAPMMNRMMHMQMGYPGQTMPGGPGMGYGGGPQGGHGQQHGHPGPQQHRQGGGNPNMNGQGEMD